MERVVPDTITPEDPKDLRTKLNKALKDLETANAKNLQLTTSNLMHQANLGHLNEHQRKAVVSMLDKDADVDLKAITAAAKDLGYEPKEPTSPTTQVPGQVPGQIPGQVPGQPFDPNSPNPQFDPNQLIPPGQPLMDPNMYNPQYPPYMNQFPQDPNMYDPNQYPAQQQPGQMPGQFPGQPPTQYAQNPGQVPGQVPNPANPAIAQAIAGLSQAEQAQIMAGRQSQTTAGAYSDAIAKAQSPEQVMNIVRTMGPQVGIFDADLME